MEHFAQIITQPWMVAVFVSIILLVAMRPLYQAIVSINTVNRELDTAIGILSGLGKNLQDEFYAQFKSINSQILKIPGLSHAWHEFADSMYFEHAGAPNAPRKVYLSHRPSRYFNRESVLGLRLNISQFLAYPNYLIGIGLTFTFIGLAAALHVAQAGLASGAGQQALKDLLAVASIKFTSSIVGISSSLIIAAIQRIRIRAFQQKLDTFCDLLEECTKYKSTEKLLHDTFSEQRAQTLALEGLGDRIAASIGDAVGRHLSHSVTQAFDPLAQEIQALARQFAQGSETALRQMLAEFSDHLHRHAAVQMQELLSSARALKDVLDGLAGGMHAAGKELSADVRASTTRLEESLGQFASMLVPVGQDIARFGQLMSSLEPVAQTAREAGNQFHHAAEQNRLASREFEKALIDAQHSLSPVADAFRHAGQHIQAAAEENRQNAAAFAQAVSDGHARLVPLEEGLSALTQSLSRTAQTAQELERAGRAIALAAEEFKRSAAMADESESRLKDHLGRLDTSAQHVSGAAGALEKTVHMLSDAVTAMKKSEGSTLSRLTSKWRK